MITFHGPIWYCDVDDYELPNLINPLNVYQSGSEDPDYEP